MVEVKGSADVDVALNRLNGRLMVNLVNTAGPHDDVEKAIFDSIPIVGPLEMTLRLPAAPKRITLEPGNQPVEFKYANGEARLTVPKLEIHQILAVD